MGRKILIGAISEQIERNQFVYRDGLQKTEYSLVATAEYIKPDTVYVIASKQTIEDIIIKNNKTAYEYFLNDMKRVNGNINCFPIKAGNDANSLESLWSTFDQLTEAIQDGDEIYFDVTGGIRAIVVILISMIHYLKQIKPSIIVKDVLYSQIGHNTEKGYLYSIGYFVQLEDWAIAIQNYVNYGDAKNLLELVKNENKESSAYRLVHSLQMFSECMKLCRLKDAKQYYKEVEENIDDFFNTFEIIDQSEVQRYVDKKIGVLKNTLAKKFDNFKENTIFGSVEWNLMHRNYQQVLTILNESIPYLLEEYGYFNDKKDIEPFKSIAECDTLDDWTIEENKITINQNYSNRLYNLIQAKLLERFPVEQLTFSLLCEVLKVKTEKNDLYFELSKIINDKKYYLKDYDKNLDNYLSHILNEQYLRPYLRICYAFLREHENINREEMDLYVKLLRQKKNFNFSILKDNQSIDVLRKMVEVNRAIDKNKKLISCYNEQFENDNKNNSHIKKIYEPKIGTVNVTNLFIENKDLMLELFKKYNRLRNDRNMINHAQFIPDKGNHYFEEIMSGEYDELIFEICDCLKQLIKKSEVGR